MAIPRETLTALDGFDQSTDWANAFERANKRLAQWLTSGSFLTVHLAIFGASLLALFLWAMISHPTDLSTLRPFVYWGIVAAIHAALTGAYAGAARLMGWDLPAFEAEAAPVYRQIEAHPHQAASASGWVRAAENAPVTTLPARSWAAGTHRSPARVDDQAPGAWPRQPAILHASEREDVGEVTWPGTAPLSTMLNAPSTSLTNPADEVVSIDPGAHTGAQEDRTRSWLEGFVESRTRDKEQRWSWIEAAAASWMARREPAREEPAVRQPEDVVLASDAESSPESDAPGL